jgi:hypothetical protein
MDGLFQPEEPFYKISIGFIDFTFNAVSTLTFGGFFGEQVTSIRLPVHDLSGCGNFKSLFCPGMGFNLWHCFSFTYYPAGGPAQAERFWNRLG